MSSAREKFIEASAIAKTALNEVEALQAQLTAATQARKQAERERNEAWKRWWMAMAEVYHHYCPGWAQDGTPEMMARNIIHHSPVVKALTTANAGLVELLAPCKKELQFAGLNRELVDKIRAALAAHPAGEKPTRDEAIRAADEFARIVQCLSPDENGLSCIDGDASKESLCACCRWLQKSQQSKLDGSPVITQEQEGGE